MMANATVQTPPLLTAEEFFALAPDVPCELVRGEVIYLSPAGSLHGNIAIQLGSFLVGIIRDRDLGKGFAAETGFILSRDPDTVRAPDFAFVSKERLPGGRLPDGFFPGPPDLAVEVVSPSDSWVDVEEKLSEYLAAGTREVWVVNPKLESIQVCTPRSRIVLRRDEILTSDLFPGFHLPLSELF
jgi:Uma2 family endonuclease